MLLLVGYVHVNETIIVRLFQGNYDGYSDYYFIHIALN